MPRPAHPAYARYTTEAIRFFGQLIRKARLERKETAASLAGRAGVSRGLIQRIERGDPCCSIGVVVEVAALVGIRLYDHEHQTFAKASQVLAEILALMPSSARTDRKPAKDEF